MLSFTGERRWNRALTGSACARAPRHRPRRVRAALGLHRRRRRHRPRRTPPISGDNQRRAGSTAIWDAIWVTSREVLSETSDKTRRAIILLTDGVDTSSRLKMNEAIDSRPQGRRHHLLHRHRRQLHFSGVDEGSLRKISERTGGRAYFPRNEDDLRVGLRADSGGAALAVPRRLLALEQGEGRHLPQSPDRDRQPRAAQAEPAPHLPPGLLRAERRRRRTPGGSERCRRSARLKAVRNRQAASLRLPLRPCRRCLTLAYCYRLLSSALSLMTTARALCYIQLPALRPPQPAAPSA